MRDHALRASGFLGPEFNEFLFDSIGLDQYGRSLSVVSALARLDLDAWAEAAQLARLPRDAAADKLSVLIRMLTECPQAVRDSHKIAVRLVALLPSRAVLAGQKAAPAAVVDQAGKFGFSTIWFVLIIVMLLGMQQLVSHAPAPVAPPAIAATIPSMVHQ